MQMTEAIKNLLGNKIDASDEGIKKLTKDLNVEEIRVIRPNQPVTRDFRPSRLNISVSNKMEVESLKFG